MLSFTPLILNKCFIDYQHTIHFTVPTGDKRVRLLKNVSPPMRVIVESYDQFMHRLKVRENNRTLLDAFINQHTTMPFGLTPQHHAT